MSSERRGDGRGGRAAWATAICLAAAAMLVGCGESQTFSTENEKEVDLRLGLLEPSKDDRVPQRSEDAIKTLVLRVTDLEFGTTRRGRMLTVYGEVTDSGWYQPELAPRNDGAPGPDGFLEFDLLAADPVMNGLPQAPIGTARQREVRANAILDRQLLDIAQGVRVNAESGPVTVRFAQPDSELPRPPGG